VKNYRKITTKAIYKLHTLFYVVGLTFGLILHDKDVNIVKGHDIRFGIYLEPLTIHHELISFCIHDCNRSIG
jgi:hypothetical protein